MSGGATLSVGFIPLVDAAPIVVAREMGFAAEEGLRLDLVRAPSWSSLRDMLSLGRVEAAHMLAPVPVANALGLGGAAARMDALMVLSVNGNVIAASAALAGRMRALAGRFAFDDARAAGKALLAVADRRLRFGVPFPFSMHAELLHYWLSGLGLPVPQGLEVRTVPPPLMADAIRSGEVDAFCVGEPWGSLAVEQGLGELLLPTRAIWAFAPEKVLAVRSDWVRGAPAVARRLVRAIWRAGRWLAEPANRTLAAEILARPEYLGIAPEIIDRALSGELVISPCGEQRHVEGFVEFHRNAATFPWRSQAQWIAGRLAARMGLDRVAAMARAGDVFRADLYRAALADAGADLPGASSKVEGSVESSVPVASTLGRLFLARDVFFDRRIFDPDAPIG